jgi:hypothetical protein
MKMAFLDLGALAADAVMVDNIIPPPPSFSFAVRRFTSGIGQLILLEGLDSKAT